MRRGRHTHSEIMMTLGRMPTKSAGMNGKLRRKIIMQRHDGQRIYSRMLTNYGTEVPRCTRQKGAHSRQGEQRREAHAEHVSAREDVAALKEDDLAGDEEDG